MFPQRIACVTRSVLCSLLWVTTVVYADEHENERLGFSITPHVGMRVGGSVDSDDDDGDYDLDDASSYGLTLSIPWESDTELELWYSRQETEIDLSDVGASGSTDLDLDFYHIGGTIFLEPQKYAIPFVVFTLGATHASSSERGIDSDTFGSFSLGGGWQFFPEKRVGLRLEGRVLGTYIDDDSDVFCAVVPGVSGCAIAVSGEMVWQFEVNAGAVFRF